MAPKKEAVELLAEIREYLRAFIHVLDKDSEHKYMIRWYSDDELKQLRKELKKLMRKLEKV